MELEFKKDNTRHYIKVTEEYGQIFLSNVEKGFHFCYGFFCDRNQCIFATNGLPDGCTLKAALGVTSLEGIEVEKVGHGGQAEDAEEKIKDPHGESHTYIRCLEELKITQERIIQKQEAEIAACRQISSIRENLRLKAVAGHKEFFEEAKLNEKIADEELEVKDTLIEKLKKALSDKNLRITQLEQIIINYQIEKLDN